MASKNDVARVKGVISHLFSELYDADTEIKELKEQINKLENNQSEEKYTLPIVKNFIAHLAREILEACKEIDKLKEQIRIIKDKE